MVYDCFAFFNELELLEIRLNELNAVVDKFVIVEADRTFQKKPKPLIFKENKDRFKEFEHKIIHVVVDQYPGFFAKFRIPNPWDYGNHQKEQILQGLTNAGPEDDIIISDIDEIPDPEKIKAHLSSNETKVFEQKLFYYFLNGSALKKDDSPDLWRGSVMMKRKNLVTIKKGRLMRDKEGLGITVVKNGGWHFSYLGGVDKIIEKIEALEHTEFNKDYYKDPVRLEQIITSGGDIFDREGKYRFIELDETFPSYVRSNIEKFKHLIRK